VITTPDPAGLFPDLAPGAAVALPPAPIDDREAPAVVWTGTELIVWGGVADGRSLGDGAAHDVASGTWRTLAPAPISGRSHAAIAWTGTELVVWGGVRTTGTDPEGAPRLVGVEDGAAYDPATDTWRALPAPPVAGMSSEHAVWTGDELVVVSSDRSAAYDPSADRWRRIADAPTGLAPPVWTGEVILTMAPQEDGVSRLLRYDPRTDGGWQTVDDEVDHLTLVAVPDTGTGRAGVLAPSDVPGAPVVVLDAAGNAVGTVAGNPDQRFGLLLDATGTWAGDDALFWIRSARVLDPLQPAAPAAEEAWSLDPEAQTWRTLPAGTAPPSDHLLPVADDLFLAWGRLPSNPDGPSTAVAYRAP
jgi:hypothetical protein